MAVWEISEELHELAERVIRAKEDVSHVEPQGILCLREYEIKKRHKGAVVLADVRSTHDEPYQLWTDAEWIVTFYEQNLDGMNDRQRAIVMWHELKHIPETGHKCKPHDVQDFYAIIKEMGVDWQSNSEVPDILEGSDL